METYHALDGQAVLRALGTAAGGLSAAEAAVRLTRHGPNRLRPRRGRTPLERFLLQFHNVLIYILLAAAAVTAALGHWVDTGVIVGVVVINAVVGFIQEGKAEQALAAIRRMLSLRSRVLRDGRPVTIPAEEIVPGDVILIQSGDRVPADLRLLKVKNLRVDEASLTGESVPVEKDVAPVAADSPLGDRVDMAYSGTFVTYGQGAGVAVATGDATELGRISELLAEVERIETPLLRKLAVFGRWLSAAIVAVAALTFPSARSYAITPPRTCFSRRSGSRSPPSPRGCRRSSPSRWRWACSAWRGATPSCACCRRSRPWGA